ncbi:MAG TPA: M23 family metallopeptidase [Sphingomicrobium sp.]|nr:M23 family metallopeptidase [Sphingomicrobium sp.]
MLTRSAWKWTALGYGIVLAVLAAAIWIFVTNIFSPAGPGLSNVGERIGTAPPRTDEPLRPASVAVAPSGLAVPVDGVRPGDLVDTYTQSRAGGARVHNAIDIMSPVGRAVVAAAPGRVEKIFWSKGGGGNTVYVRSDDGRWQYYYAHLDAYAPGLREGQRVERGTPLGTVGVSGNANPAGPHLHFAINRMEPHWKWHQGVPVNPYPLLAGKGERG